MHSIGKRIKQRRQELGLSQIELAYQINISPGNLSKLEAGSSLPSSQALIKLSEALDCSTDWLLLGNTEPLADASPLLEEYIKLFDLLEQNNQEEIVEIIKIKLRFQQKKGKK